MQAATLRARAQPLGEENYAVPGTLIVRSHLLPSYYRNSLTGLDHHVQFHLWVCVLGQALHLRAMTPPLMVQKWNVMLLDKDVLEVGSPCKHYDTMSPCRILQIPALHVETNHGFIWQVLWRLYHPQIIHFNPYVWVHFSCYRQNTSKNITNWHPYSTSFFGTMQ